VTNEFDATISQYDIDPLTGTLSAKTPPVVSTGQFPGPIAATPSPRVPTRKDQCTTGGWHNYPQFKNQGDCVSFVATARERASEAVALAERYGLEDRAILALALGAIGCIAIWMGGPGWLHA
jgi:hypothetical protein